MRFRVPILSNPEIQENFEQLEEGSWGVITLLHGWKVYGAPYAPPSFYRDGFEWVHLRGAIKEGENGKAAFILPVGFRPAYPLNFPMVVNGGIEPKTYLNISPNGEVIPNAVGGAPGPENLKSYCSLDVPSFLAGQ